MTYEQYKRYIQTSLTMTDRKVNTDRQIFNGFCRGAFSIEETLKMFIDNNELDRDLEVEHFRRWLIELGYREGEYE